MRYYKRTKEETADFERKFISSDTEAAIAKKTLESGGFYALSVKAPWAWLIVNGFKDVENRKWKTKFRGRLIIQAAGNLERRDYADAYTFAASIDSEIAAALPPFADCQKLERLALGSVEVADVFERPVAGVITSPWHTEGCYGLKLVKPRIYNPAPSVRGQLGIFQLPEELNPIFQALENPPKKGKSKR